MSPWRFSKLIMGNLPHLMGILLYGLIAITLAVICYKVFSKILALNTSINASPEDRLTSVILAVGVIIGISFLVAITAYQPPKIPTPPKNSLSSASGCGSGSHAPGCGSTSNPLTTQKAPGKQVQQPPAQAPGTQDK